VLDAASPPVLPEPSCACRVGDGVDEGGCEVGHEPVGVDRRPRPVLELLDRHEPAGLAVDDHLGDPACRRPDDRCAAGHGLQVDDSERLVDGRADEDGRVREQLPQLVPGHDTVDPDDSRARGLQLLDQTGDLGHDLRGVRRPGAQHELDVLRQRGGGTQQVRQPLLPGDAADEDDAGSLRVDPEARHVVGAVVRIPLLGVDAVVDHVHLVGVQLGVAAQDVAAHAVADGDDGGRPLVCGAFGERRQGVSPAELLGLPRPQRLEAVRSDDVRHLVEQTGHVTGEVGVPGVRMDQVDPVHPALPSGVASHAQVHTERLQGSVLPCEVRRVVVRRDRGFLARLAEAADVQVDVAPECLRELGDVHARAAVHLRWVLLGENLDAHLVRHRHLPDHVW
jgi:hypothetical protein